MKEKNVYDDGNIPKEDLPKSKNTNQPVEPFKNRIPLPGQDVSDVIPDEVPRKDGPGGEGM